jgi:hypothetical protein
MLRDALGADAGIYLDSSALAKLYVPLISLTLSCASMAGHPIPYADYARATVCRHRGYWADPQKELRFRLPCFAVRSTLGVLQVGIPAISA